jgi:hypothetical protein
MNKPSLPIVPGIFCLALLLVPIAASAEDVDAEVNKAVENAKKAMEKSGVQMPDIKKLMDDAEAEDTDAPKKKTAADTVKTDDKSQPAATPAPKPKALAAMPDWVPAVRGFKANGPGEIVVEDNVETGTMKGTSKLPPDEISAAWHDAAAGKFSISISNASINGDVTVTVHLTDTKDSTREARLVIERAEKATIDTITVSYIITTPLTPERQRQRAQSHVADALKLKLPEPEKLGNDGADALLADYYKLFADTQALLKSGWKETPATELDRRNTALTLRRYDLHESWIKKLPIDKQMHVDDVFDAASDAISKAVKAGEEFQNAQEASE